MTPIQLPPPPKTCGTDLVAAFALRRSTREYDSSRGIADDVLSALLWAANGVTASEDRRTAPSAFGGNQIRIYVAGHAGVVLYDAPSHTLSPVSSTDIRKSLAPDEWVGTAPVALILTGQRDKFPDFVSAEMRPELLQANAGCIAENIHLMAAALALGTCMVGHMHTDAVAEALRLPSTEVPLYVMPVGYLPK